MAILTSDSDLSVVTSASNIFFTSSSRASTYAGVRVEGAWLGSVGDWGSGSGALLSIANATTAPTANPSGGGIVYAEGGAVKWRGSGGAISTLAPAGTGTVNTQNNLWIPVQATVRTTDATPTTLVTYSPPVNSGSVIRALVVGRNASTDAVAIYTIVSGHTRAGGAPTAYSTTTVVEEPGAGYDAAIAVSGNNLVLSVTGDAVTMDWLARVEILEN